MMYSIAFVYNIGDSRFYAIVHHEATDVHHNPFTSYARRCHRIDFKGRIAGETETGAALGGADGSQAARCRSGLHCRRAADLEAYRDAIHADRLRKSPEKTWDHLTWVWNGCVRNVPSWPSITIERKSRRRIYVLPWPNFPPSLKEDVDRFLDRLSGRDLSDDGPVRPARPSTIKTREYQLRVAASALVQCGHNPQRLRSIADMLSFERYQEILRVLMGRHGGETSPQVGQIAAFLKDVARHWLKVDELELQRFKKIASRLAVGRRA